MLFPKLSTDLLYTLQEFLHSPSEESFVHFKNDWDKLTAGAQIDLLNHNLDNGNTFFGTVYHSPTHFKLFAPLLVKERFFQSNAEDIYLTDNKNIFIYFVDTVAQQNAELNLLNLSYEQQHLLYLGVKYIIKPYIKIKSVKIPSDSLPRRQAIQDAFEEIRMKTKDALPNTPLKHEVYQFLEKMKSDIIDFEATIRAKNSNVKVLKGIAHKMAKKVSGFEQKHNIHETKEANYFYSYLTFIYRSQFFNPIFEPNNFLKDFQKEKISHPEEVLIQKNILNGEYFKTPTFDFEIDKFQLFAALLEQSEIVKKNKILSDKIVLQKEVAKTDISTEQKKFKI